MKKILVSIILGSAVATGAQTPVSSPLAEGYIERARIMLRDGNYPGVIDQIETLRSRGVKLLPAEEEEALRLMALARYERGEEEGTQLLLDFAARYPSSPYADSAVLTAADSYFFRHDWKKALELYSKVDIVTLGGERRTLYSYRKMLCYLKTGDVEAARPLLARLENAKGYGEAWRFYTAYIDYKEGRIDNAYRLFSQVTSQERGLQAGYYLAQIDYSRGEFEKTAAKGAAVLRNLQDPELAPELNRITGISLFKLHEYSRARGYLAKYAESVAQPARDVVYALGVCDFENDDLSRAAERFAQLTDTKDVIGQSAWLYMGQCDVKNGNDDAAAMAFEKAARMDLDPQVSEVAMYNYVAALTRGGKVPFSSSVDMLEGFIKLFPNSEYTQQVEEYLATAYYNDRNYAKALASIEKIKHPTSAVLSAKQNILYELGISAVTNGNGAEAEGYLNRAIELAQYNKMLALQARLWLGDALYQQGRFTQAAAQYREFINGSDRDSNRTLAMYNLAYAEYQAEKYGEAAADFAKAMDANPSLPGALSRDARLRLADCRYYTGDYRKARDTYAEAVREGGDSDYASYRHAVMLGLAGDISGKISELERFPNTYPNSKWIPNVLLEKGMAFDAVDRQGDAARAFRELAASYPKAGAARQGMINLAISQMKSGKSDDGAETYREIIRTWPTSEEANIANEDLRKYYASKGTLHEYAAFLKSVPEAKQLDADEMEKLAFDGAETAYAENVDSIALLLDYLKDYPDGRWLAPALFDVAYSKRNSGNDTEALIYLSKLIESRPHSAQYPEALLMKGEILQDGDENARREALAVFRELEKTGDRDFVIDANAGIARNSSDDAEIIAYAAKVRESGVGEDITEEMDRLAGGALIRQGKVEEGEALLRKVAANPATLYGAKSAVELGRSLLARKQYAAAEKEMLKFTEAGTPHQFQLAQGFIILADAYTAQGKKYLAKEYLVSLKENYPGTEPEIIEEIEKRLN